MVAPIRPYESQVNTPTADFSGRRANEGDFGYGAAMYELGNTISRTADVIKRQQEQDELAEAQMTIARSQDYFSTRIMEEQKNAKPGNFIAGKVRSEMEEYYANTANAFKSPAAQKYVKMNGMETTSRAFKSAIAFDVDLKAKDQFAKQDEYVDMAGKRIISGLSSYEDERNKIIAEREAGVGIWDSSYLDARGKLAADETFKKRIEALATVTADSSLTNPAFRATALTAVRNGVERSMTASAVEFAKSYDTLKPEQKQIEASIRNTAQMYGVDPDFMVALALRESSLNPKAKNLKSSAGGVFQFIDDTWNRMAPGQDKMDANANIDAGVRMFAQHLKQFNGNYDLALAAHHVGAEKAKQALTDSTVGDVDTSTKDWLAGIHAAKAKMSGEAVMPEIQEVPKEVKAQMPAFFNDLSPEKQVSYIRQLNQIDKQQRNLAMERTKKRAQDDMQFAIVNGKLPAKQLTAADFGGNTELMAEYQATMSGIEQGKALVNASPAEQQRFINNYLQQNPNDPVGFYDNKVRIANAMQRTFQASNEEWTKDPIAKVRTMATEGVGAVPEALQPLDFSGFGANMPDTAQKIGLRIFERSRAGFGTVAAQRGGKYALVDNNEAKQLRAVVQTMEPKIANKFIGEMTTRLGRSEAASLMLQMYPDNTAFASAAVLHKTEWANPVEREKDSETILRGMKYMQPKEGEKPSQTGSKDLVMPSDNEFERTVAGYLKGIKIDDPKQIRNILDTVKAHALGTSLDKKTYDMSYAKGGKQLVTNSLKKLYPKTDFNGSDILIPYGIEPSKFRENANALVSEATGGKLGKGDYTLVYAPVQGKYVVQAGNANVIGANGEPVSIDPTRAPYIGAKPSSYSGAR